MKLINENLNQIKLILFIIIIIMELIALIIVINLYKPIYKKAIELTKNHTINKTISTIKILKDISLLHFYRQILDLKLAGKHMVFLGNEENESMYMKRSSKFFDNILASKNKKIVYGTMEKLKENIPTLYEKYYDEEKKRFDYFLKYYEDEVIKGPKSRIIYSLTNNKIHPELDMIAYYKLRGESDMPTDENRKRAAFYLISILKTNIIKRFITSGKNFDLLNYMLFVEDEVYIYPPEAFNNTHLYFISNMHQFNCGQGNAINTFPKCVYEFVKNNMHSEIPGFFFPQMFGSKIKFDQITMNFCMNIPFDKIFDLQTFSYSPLLCYESNLTKLFLANTFEQKEEFEFIFFLYGLQFAQDIVPIYNGKKEVYEEIKTVFKDQKFKEFSLSRDTQFFPYFSLFHFLYLDIFKDENCIKNLNVTIDDLINEYKEIANKISNQIEILKNNKEQTASQGNANNEEEYRVLDVEKTVCRSDIYNNNYTCFKDTFIYLLYPINGDLYYINDVFLEDQRFPIYLPFFYSLSIIRNNNKYMEWKLKNIMLIKIIKLFIFYCIISVSIILFYFILVQIFYETRFNAITQITEIINDGSFFEIKDKNEIIKIKESIIVEPNNKDMTEVQNIFDTLTKSMLLKMNFDEKIIYYNKKMIRIKKNIKTRINKKNNLYSITGYMDLIKSINNPETKIMCIYIISYDHFKKRMYKIAENEFKNLILDINIYENRISNKNEDNDSKLKDSISRFSKISYLNEYSLTSGMNETTLPIIKAKLLKQKILYLYALSIYNQEKTKKNNLNTIRDNKKNNNEDVKKRYEEAIKFFTECKNISSLLGTDIIREIFSLIMISKCYLELRNYKESMININEALLLFLDLQKAFKDKAYFNPKVMLFAGNYIFQNIMITMAQTTYNFGKYPQSCWILMNLIETSPFIFNNIHFNACYMLNVCLKQLDNNNIPPRQLEKYRKNINKIYNRINIRLLYSEKNKNDDSRTLSNNSSNNAISNPSATKSQIASILKRSTNKKDFLTNKLNTVSMNSSININRNRYKNITLCMSEKIIMKINGEELKDVLIKFFKKCFSNSPDEDKFTYIQFSYNGKKTITIKSESLDVFLQKLESNKAAFQLNENYNKKTNEIQFLEFANLFFSIINSQKEQNFDNKNDNIIILFINTEDMRFNGKKECVDTINELNNNNYSLIVFTYDILISNKKVMNIRSFISGLNDGHFFQIKNYQQIKQVLMNFSNKESQEKFVNYDYEITDYML